MNLDNLIISTSPLTGQIYAGYSKDNGKSFSHKVDVTQQVISAMCAHMYITGIEYECQAGELIFKPKESEQNE
ncbi:hypothetical protein [Paenibacillus sp. NAIST15-1]|uniref:DUF7446 family protein n=1 Tax=Paenibacillus sp. NAIST15-1 TaxID=1605994 RepID=UPI0009335E00|nr:hypothetical protein [Paenibacillus sp. NAIST15-1]